MATKHMSQVVEHLTELFSQGDGELRLMSTSPEGDGLCARFGGGEGVEAELWLFPRGAMPARYASTPACDVVVPPGATVDEGQVRLIDGVVRTLEADERGLAQWTLAGMGPEGRYRAADAVEIKLTAACDQRCVFCKSPANLANHATPLQAIEMLPGLAADGRVLTLSGGEPTLLDELTDVVATATRAGFKEIEVQTNGMNLARPGYAQQLNDAGVTSLLISLHSHREQRSDQLTGTPGGYGRTLQGIDNAHRTGVAVALCHVICQGNHRELEHYADFVRRRFAGQLLQVVFTLAIPTYRVRDDPGLMPPLAAVGPLLERALTRFDAVHGQRPTAAWLRGKIPGAPRLATASRRFFAALARGRLLSRYQARHKARVIAGSGLPPCVLGAQARYHDELWGEPGRWPALVHPPLCEPCIYRSSCSGLWPAYLEHHGTLGISPRRSPRRSPR